MRSGAAKFFEAIWYRGSWIAVLLVPVSWVYRLLLASSRKRGLSRAVALPVPVIVVGNITVGGTGKTPIVMWLARELQRSGHRPGIVTRGYLGKATAVAARVPPNGAAADFGDEAVLLARRLDCPVIAGHDRVACVQYLLERESVDLVVSDDGLQHFALPGDCTIVVVDGRRGLGNGRLLPAGPLREPATRLDAVDLILVNGPHWSHQRALTFELRSTTVRRLSDGLQRTLSDFAGRSVHALAAIGHPERFFEMLRQAGCIVDAHPWPDHSPIPVEDLKFDDGAPVLITEKDAVKCSQAAPPDVWSVDVDVAFTQAAAATVMQTVAERAFGAAADK